MLFASVTIADAKSIVFTLKFGQQVYYLLGGETNPVMRFVDGKIVMNDDTYEFSGIKNFRYSATDDPSAIETVSVAERMKLKGNILVARCGAKETVRVRDLSGKEVVTAVSRDGESTVVNLNPLPSGTYVISIGNSSIKVMKR